MVSYCPLIMGGVLHKPADTAAEGRDQLVRRAAGRVVYAGWVTYFDPQGPAHVESPRQMWKDIAGTALLEALRRPGTPKATVRELRMAVQWPHPAAHANPRNTASARLTASRVSSPTRPITPAIRCRATV